MEDLMVDDAAAKVQLSLITIAYSLLFYYAILALALGLANRVWWYLRKRPALKTSVTNANEGPAAMTVRLASEVVFLRSTFFADRWAWIFGACFHAGLILVLIRHLRYALEPAWLGPLWMGVTMAQPFGLYGGFVMLFGVLGFWGRRMLVRELREKSTLSDYLLLALLTAIPVVGYINNWVHTDVIAVKTFFLGLARFDWQPLPSDPLLLTHLWLVAALMVALPFSKLLHMPGVLEATEEEPSLLQSRKIRLAMVGVLGLLLVAPAAVAGFEVTKEGWTKAPPDFSKLARIHKAQDPTVMIRNHPNLLISHRSVVVYKGMRVATDTIEQCVTCHAIKGADALPVGIDDPKHFCRECHTKAAVTIDCFECHNSKPTTGGGHAALDPLNQMASAFPDNAARQRSLAR